MQYINRQLRIGRFGQHGVHYEIIVSGRGNYQQDNSVIFGEKKLEKLGSLLQKSCGNHVALAGKLGMMVWKVGKWLGILCGRQVWILPHVPFIQTNWPLIMWPDLANQILSTQYEYLGPCRRSYASICMVDFKTGLYPRMINSYGFYKKNQKWLVFGDIWQQITESIVGPKSVKAKVTLNLKCSLLK